MASEMDCYANTLAYRWKMSDYDNLINYMIKTEKEQRYKLGYVLRYTTAH